MDKIMHVLGLDIGSKRTGIAISDSLGITAQALSVFESEKDGDLIEYIRGIVDEKGVGEIVVGLPLNMDGSYGEQAKNALSTADMLKDKLAIPVKLWDERMSTIEVERIMIEADASRMKRKKRVDKLAAQVMLQSYLNAEKNK